MLNASWRITKKVANILHGRLMFYASWRITRKEEETFYANTQIFCTGGWCFMHLGVLLGK